MRAIKTLRTGEVETLTPDSPVIFTGLLMGLDSPTAILLSQQMYANEQPLMNIAEDLA